MLGHVRGVRISVDTTQPEVYKLKGGVITSIIKGTLVKAFHCNKIKCMCVEVRGCGNGWTDVSATDVSA